MATLRTSPPYTSKKLLHYTLDTSKLLTTEKLERLEHIEAPNLTGKHIKNVGII